MTEIKEGDKVSWDEGRLREAQRRCLQTRSCFLRTFGPGWHKKLFTVQRVVQKPEGVDKGELWVFIEDKHNQPVCLNSSFFRTPINETTKKVSKPDAKRLI